MSTRSNEACARKLARTACVGWLIALSACSAPATYGDAREGGVARVEVGVGESAFEPFAEGATLPLVRGCQGSQHVWIAVRTAGMTPDRAVVSITLERATDEARVGALQLRIDLTPAGVHAEVSGLTLVVPEPEAAIGEALTLRASVRDAHGAEAAVTRSVRVAWGTGGCPGHGG